MARFGVGSALPVSASAVAVLASLVASPSNAKRLRFAGKASPFFALLATLDKLPEQ